MVKRTVDGPAVISASKPDPGALQDAILSSANFSSIATDEKGVIQLFNVGAERMLGYRASDVIDKITPADISDPDEVIARAAALSLELGTPVTPGFDALAFKASRGIEVIYELIYIRKRHFSRFYKKEDIDVGKPQENLAAAAASGRHETEGWRVRKDGSTFWANVVITAIRDQAGHLRGFAKLTRDLTERNKVEMAL